eukprot:COSAG02_NODE_2429_length_8885_cov_3.820965_6_plen_77_part_00
MIMYRSYASHHSTTLVLSWPLRRTAFAPTVGARAGPRVLVARGARATVNHVRCTAVALVHVLVLITVIITNVLITN